MFDSYSILKVVPLSASAVQQQNEYDKENEPNIGYDTVGGILKDTKHAWTHNGPRLNVINCKTGEKVASWCFGYVIKDVSARIVCVDEIRRPSGTLPLLVIGLQSEFTGGTICVFDIYGSRVLRAIYINKQVTSVHVVDTMSGIPGPFDQFDCLLTVGTVGGDILLVDLNRQAIESAINNSEQDIKDEVDTCQLSFLPVKTIPSLDLLQRRQLAYRDNEHICTHLNAYDDVIPHFVLKGPKGEDRIHVNRMEVTVSSLCYSAQLGVLFVGYNFGAWQMWDLIHLKLIYTSPIFEDNIPVANFALQEPSDDPRAFCYVWVVYTCAEPDPINYPVAVLYSLNYERKKFLDGYGVLYQNLSNCSVRFQSELNLLDEDIESSSHRGGYCLGLQAINTTISIGGSLHENQEESISLCCITWNCWSSNSKQLKTYMSLFDLNQWYKAQMPSTQRAGESSAYISHVCLSNILHEANVEPILNVCININTLKHFVGSQRLEEHYHPSSLAFQMCALTEYNVIYINNHGTQRALLSHLETGGPLALIKPTSFFQHVVDLGLLPLFVDMPLNSSATFEQQREILLSVALEQKLLGWLCRCALDWNNGSYSSTGCTLSFLLNWGWQRAETLKGSADSFCVSLFDYSGFRLDANAHNVLSNCARQLRNLATLFDYIVHKCINCELETVQHQRESLQMAAVHLEVLLWLLNIGLLPECPLSSYPRVDEFNRVNAPYDVDQLNKYYNERRAYLQSLSKTQMSLSDSFLFIDNFINFECGGSKLLEQWEVDGGNGLYPPSSMQASIRTYLIEDVDISTKHRVILYLFLDIITTLDHVEYKHVITNLLKFPAIFHVPPSAIKITQGFWKLDHGDFMSALDLLLDPLVSSGDFKLWQHRVVLNTLLVQEQYSLALSYLQVRRPPLTDETDICTVLSLFVANSMIDDAFRFQRLNKYNAAYEKILEHFFKECDQRGTVSFVQRLPLTVEEKEVFTKYLQRVKHPKLNNVQISNHIQHPHISSPETGNVWKEVEKPKPLSVLVHGSQQQIKYQSSSIHAKLALVTKENVPQTPRLICPRIIDEPDEDGPSPCKRFKLSPRLSVASSEFQSEKGSSSVHLHTPIIRRKMHKQSIFFKTTDEYRPVLTPQSILKVRAVVNSPDVTSSRARSKTPDNLADIRCKTPIRTTEHANFNLTSRKSLPHTPKPVVHFDISKRSSEASLISNGSISYKTSNVEADIRSFENHSALNKTLDSSDEKFYSPTASVSSNSELNQIHEISSSNTTVEKITEEINLDTDEPPMPDSPKPERSPLWPKPRKSYRLSLSDLPVRSSPRLKKLEQNRTLDDKLLTDKGLIKETLQEFTSTQTSKGRKSLSKDMVSRKVEDESFFFPEKQNVSNEQSLNLSTVSTRSRSTSSVHTDLLPPLEKPFSKQTPSPQAKLSDQQGTTLSTQSPSRRTRTSTPKRTPPRISGRAGIVRTPTSKAKQKLFKHTEGSPQNNQLEESYLPQKSVSEQTTPLPYKLRHSTTPDKEVASSIQRYVTRQSVSRETFSESIEHLEESTVHTPPSSVSKRVSVVMCSTTETVEKPEFVGELLTLPQSKNSSKNQSFESTIIFSPSRMKRTSRLSPSRTLSEIDKSETETIPISVSGTYEFSSEEIKTPKKVLTESIKHQENVNVEVQQNASASLSKVESPSIAQHLPENSSDVSTLSRKASVVREESLQLERNEQSVFEDNHQNIHKTNTSLSRLRYSSRLSPSKIVQDQKNVFYKISEQQPKKHDESNFEHSEYRADSILYPSEKSEKSPSNRVELLHLKTNEQPILGDNRQHTPKRGTSPSRSRYSTRNSPSRVSQDKKEQAVFHKTSSAQCITNEESVPEPVRRITNEESVPEAAQPIKYEESVPEQSQLPLSETRSHSNLSLGMTSFPSKSETNERLIIEGNRQHTHKRKTLLSRTRCSGRLSPSRVSEIDVNASSKRPVTYDSPECTQLQPSDNQDESEKSSAVKEEYELLIHDDNRHTPKRRTSPSRVRYSARLSPSRVVDTQRSESLNETHASDKQLGFCNTPIMQVSGSKSVSLIESSEHLKVVPEQSSLLHLESNSRKFESIHVLDERLSLEGGENSSTNIELQRKPPAVDQNISLEMMEVDPSLEANKQPLMENTVEEVEEHRKAFIKNISSLEQPLILPDKEGAQTNDDLDKMESQISSTSFKLEDEVTNMTTKSEQAKDYYSEQFKHFKGHLKFPRPDISNPILNENVAISVNQISPESVIALQEYDEPTLDTQTDLSLDENASINENLNVAHLEVSVEPSLISSSSIQHIDESENPLNATLLDISGLSESTITEVEVPQNISIKDINDILLEPGSDKDVYSEVMKDIRSSSSNLVPIDLEMNIFEVPEDISTMSAEQPTDVLQRIELDSNYDPNSNYDYARSIPIFSEVQDSSMESLDTINEHDKNIQDDYSISTREVAKLIQSNDEVEIIEIESSDDEEELNTSDDLSTHESDNSSRASDEYISSEESIQEIVMECIPEESEPSSPDSNGLCIDLESPNVITETAENILTKTQKVPELLTESYSNKDLVIDSNVQATYEDNRNNTALDVATKDLINLENVKHIEGSAYNANIESTSFGRDILDCTVEQTVIDPNTSFDILDKTENSPPETTIAVERDDLDLTVDETVKEPNTDNIDIFDKSEFTNVTMASVSDSVDIFDQTVADVELIGKSKSPGRSTKRSHSALGNEQHQEVSSRTRRRSKSIPSTPHIPIEKNNTPSNTSKYPVKNKMHTQSRQAKKELIESTAVTTSLIDTSFESVRGDILDITPPETPYAPNTSIDVFDKSEYMNRTSLGKTNLTDIFDQSTARNDESDDERVFKEKVAKSKTPVRRLRRSSSSSKHDHLTTPSPSKVLKIHQTVTVEEDANVPARRTRSKSVDTTPKPITHITKSPEAAVTKFDIKDKQVNSVKRSRSAIVSNNTESDYCSSRRLTRKQASLMEKTLTSLEVNVADSHTTSNSGDSAHAIRGPDVDMIDPINLLDRTDFEGTPDSDEERLMQKSPVSSVSGSVVSIATRKLRSRSSSVTSRTSNRSENTAAKRKRSKKADSSQVKGPSSRLQQRSRSVDDVMFTGSPPKLRKVRAKSKDKVDDSDSGVGFSGGIAERTRSKSVVDQPVRRNITRRHKKLELTKIEEKDESSKEEEKLSKKSVK